MKRYYYGEPLVSNEYYLQLHIDTIIEKTTYHYIKEKNYNIYNVTMFII